MSLASSAVSEPTSSDAASEATAVVVTFILSVCGFFSTVRTRAEAGAGEAEAEDGMKAGAEGGVDVGDEVYVEAKYACGIVTVGTGFPIIVCKFRTRKCLTPRTWAANISALGQVTSHSSQ